MINKVIEKWGFGMAPPKLQTQNERRRACAEVLKLLGSLDRPVDSVAMLENLSITKGLFNRIVREDQWDWFTVAGQLGYPSRGISRVIAEQIAVFRAALRDANDEGYATARGNLLRLPVRRCLSVFLGAVRVKDEPGAGWVYILSTRELRDLLKIGMTTRTVESRVQEINGATGIAIPLGVRRCWRVSDPKQAERLVHTALFDYRLRDDREFFKADFAVAAPIVEAAVRASGLEIRTLNALASLNG
jgi:hypothetical protein